MTNSSSKKYKKNNKVNEERTQENAANNVAKELFQDSDEVEVLKAESPSSLSSDVLGRQDLSKSGREDLSDVSGQQDLSSLNKVLNAIQKLDNKIENLGYKVKQVEFNQTQSDNKVEKINQKVRTSLQGAKSGLLLSHDDEDDSDFFYLKNETGGSFSETAGAPESWMTGSLTSQKKVLPSKIFLADFGISTETNTDSDTDPQQASANPGVFDGEIKLDDLLGDENPFINAKINQKNRRMTINNIPGVIPNVANANSNGATVMVQPYVITEEEKMKYITLKSIKRLLESYALFKASSLDNTKTLIYFIKKECQDKLIAKQLLLQTPLSRWINPQCIYLASDAHTERMLSDYIRPTSRDDFVNQFTQAMTHPAWRKDLEFNTVNYYKDIFPHVTLFLEECVIYNDYLRRGAKEFEIDYMPKVEWGKSDPGGLFRIALAILHPYQDNFIQILKEDVLKKIKSMDVFIKYFTLVNTEISKSSLEILQKNNLMKKPQSFTTIAAQARKKSDDFKEYKSKVVRAATTSKKAYSKYPSRGSLNELEGLDDEGVANDNDQLQTELSDRDDWNLDEEEWSQKYDDNVAHREWVSKEIRNWHESEVELALHALCAIEPSSYTPRRNHDGIKIYKAKPVNTKEQTCFAYAYGNCTAGNSCVYSHDPAKIKNFLRTTYERLVGAPSWDPKIATEVGTMNNRGQGGHVRRDNVGSNHGGGRGRGAFQSPAANQKKITYSNDYSQSYIIEVEKPNGNTENKSSDLPGAGPNQPVSAEKSGSIRSPSTSGGRNESDC